jgi:hypothetical protein
VAIDGLGQEIVGTGGQALVADFLFMGGGDHQDRYHVRRVKLAYRVDELDAVQIGHHVIDNDQVGLVGAAPFEAFPWRGETHDLGAGRGEFADQSLNQGQVEGVSSTMAMAMGAPWGGAHRPFPVTWWNSDYRPGILEV